MTAVDFLATLYWGPGSDRQVFAVDNALSANQIGLNVPGALAGTTSANQKFSPGRAIYVPGYGTFAQFPDGLFLNMDTAPGQGGAWTQVVSWTATPVNTFQETPGPKLVYREGNPFLAGVFANTDVTSPTSSYRGYVYDLVNNTDVQYPGSTLSLPLSQSSNSYGNLLLGDYIYYHQFDGGAGGLRAFGLEIATGALVDASGSQGFPGLSPGATTTNRMDGRGLFMVNGPANKTYGVCGSVSFSSADQYGLYELAGQTWLPLVGLGVGTASGTSNVGGCVLYVTNPVTAEPNLICVLPVFGAGGGGFFLVRVILDAAGDVVSVGNFTSNVTAALAAGAGFGGDERRVVPLVQNTPSTGEATYRLFFAPGGATSDAWQEHRLTFNVSGEPVIGSLVASGLPASYSIPWAPVDGALYAAPVGQTQIEVVSAPVGQVAAVSTGGIEFQLRLSGGGTGLTLRGLRRETPAGANDPGNTNLEPLVLASVTGGSAVLNANTIQIDNVDADGVTIYTVVVDQSNYSEYERAPMHWAVG